MIKEPREQTVPAGEDGEHRALGAGWGRRTSPQLLPAPQRQEELADRSTEDQ